MDINLFGAFRVFITLTGLFFMLIAAIGVLRMKSFYERIHAPTKAATLGLICLQIAVVMSVPDLGVVVKAMLAVAFFGITAPAGAHMLTRAAYRSGVRPEKPFTRDDYGNTKHGVYSSDIVNKKV